MTTSDEVYREYKDTLDTELKQNLKPIFNTLTMLAEDYCENNSDVIVKAIEDFIRQTVPERKLLGLYLMDSIIKNLTQTTNYVQLFEKNIVKLFADVFNEVTEANRRALYKLRQTWQNYFQNRVLYSIDVAVNSIDNKWPISSHPDVNNTRIDATNTNTMVNNTTNSTTTNVNSNVNSKKSQLNSNNNSTNTSNGGPTNNNNNNNNNNKTPPMLATKTSQQQQNSSSSTTNNSTTKITTPTKQQTDNNKALIDQLNEKKNKLIQQINTKNHQQQQQQQLQQKQQQLPPSLLSINVNPNQLELKDSKIAITNMQSSQQSQQQQQKLQQKTQQPVKQQQQLTHAGGGGGGTTTAQTNVQKKPMPRDPRQLKLQQQQQTQQQQSQTQPQQSQITVKSTTPATASGGTLVKKIVKPVKRTSPVQPPDGTQNAIGAKKPKLIGISGVVKPKTSTETTPTKAPGTAIPKKPQKNVEKPASTSLEFNDIFGLGVGDIDLRVKEETAKTLEIGKISKTTGLQKNISTNAPSKPTAQPIKTPLSAIAASSAVQNLANSFDTKVLEDINKILKPTSTNGILNIVTTPSVAVVGTSEATNYTAISNMLEMQQKNPQANADLINMLKSLLDNLTQQQTTAPVLIPPATTTAPSLPLPPPPPPPTTTVSSQITSTTTTVPVQTIPMPLMSTTPTVSTEASSIIDTDQMLMRSPVSSSSTSSVMNQIATDLPPIKSRDRHEIEDSLLIIDGRSYRIQPDQRRIMKIYYHDHEVYCDTRTRDVHIDGRRIYTMGEIPKDITLNGRRVRLVYMGRRVELWIDGISYHFRVDSPPKRIQLTSPSTGHTKFYYATINGSSMDLYFDNYLVCNVEEGLYDRELIHHVALSPDDPEVHEIRYVCPPKNIEIDGQLRTMRYDLPIPCVEINGLFYVIRFSGPPREIIIDDTSYRVPFDRTIRIKLNNGRSHEIAWGGPGYEVIIDGRTYEIQFGHPQAREILIGARQHFVRIIGDAPNVRICGRLPDKILQEYQQQLEEERERKLRLERQNPQQQQQQQHGFGKSASSTATTRPFDSTLNVQDLISKLMKHDLIPTIDQQQQQQPSTSSATSSTTAPAEPQKPPEEPIPDLTSLDPNLLKQKFNQAVENLYSGFQCAICGMRFTNTQTSRHASHYDWHYRQNKKEKEEIKKAHFRSWYYNLHEWIQYEELSEELMLILEKDKNQDTSINNKENSLNRYSSTNEASYYSPTHESGEYNNQTSTCRAVGNMDETCHVCHDPFQVVHDKEKDEWMYMDAIRVDDKVYHPICYEDIGDTKDEYLPSSVPSTPCVSQTVSFTNASLQNVEIKKEQRDNDEQNNNNNSSSNMDESIVMCKNEPNDVDLDYEQQQETENVNNNNSEYDINNSIVNENIIDSDILYNNNNNNNNNNNSSLIFKDEPMATQ